MNEIILINHKTQIKKIIIEKLATLRTVPDLFFSVLGQKYKLSLILSCLLIFQITISLSSSPVLEENMSVLRDVWEETSFQLERRQANPGCVLQEQEALWKRIEPVYKVPFEPDMVHIVPKGKF